MREKLTALQVQKAKPAGKPYKLFDGRGLYLHVKPTGTKTWRLKYKYNGKEQLLTLGRFPDISLADARARAATSQSQLLEGKNPSAQRRANRQAPTFEEAANQWIAANNRWSVSHAASVQRILGRHVLPALGGRPIAELETVEIHTALCKLQTLGRLETLRKAVSFTSQTFKHAIASGSCKANPASGLQSAFQQPVPTHYKAAVTPESVGRVMAAIDNYSEVRTKLALKLIAYTFLRTKELINAEWKEIDFKTALWIVPGQRLKGRKTAKREDHLIPLSTQALAILNLLRDLNEHPSLIFASPQKPDQPISNNTLLFALKRMGLEETVHGFRTTASTFLNESNFRSDIIEQQLAHTERNRSRKAYNRAENLSYRRNMLQTYANWLDEQATLYKSKMNESISQFERFRQSITSDK